MLLISRVLSYIIDSACSTSTLSNPLVGFLFLVDLLLILLSLDRSLRKIYLFNYLNPFYRCASQAGIVLVVSMGGQESNHQDFPDNSLFVFVFVKLLYPEYAVSLLNVCD